MKMIGARALIECLKKEQVEVVFGYPGVGTVLYQAIRLFDYFVIYGVVMMLILAIGLATLVIDLLYPLFDPRITYQGR